MKVLVTGGAGYIGSHTAIELIAAGHEVTLLDNLCNASYKAVAAVRALANRHVPFVEGDIGDGEFLDATFDGAGFDAVVHFAGLKAVAESVAQPIRYYRNNVAGTACLVERMAAHDVKTIVFSSSATVYGEPASTPITEDSPTRPVSPYGRTKLMIEELLRDIRAADAGWRVSILRYFNPVGAHASGELGEDPIGAPNNLMPFVGQVAVGRRKNLQVFGNDYPTPDGTCIRDYVHVADLARGHVRALDFLARKPTFAVHNLGTGQGYSVLEVVHAFEKASGAPVAYCIAGRRAGDIPISYADPAKAREELGWQAEHGLDRMCRDAWRWHRRHPNGFRN